LPLRLPRFFQRRPAPSPISTGGRLIYAVGDVHGRLDLLEPLLEQISADAASGETEDRPVLVFVGDYVDRGTASKGVIDRVIDLTDEGRFDVCALKGNHEEAMLTFLQDPHFGPTWSEHGGAQTLVSYGVTAPMLRMDDEQWEAARQAFAEALPMGHLTFLRSLSLTATFGDYLFVHAGLRPGGAVEDQAEHHLLWIRQEFLNAPRPFEKIVVHGHTPAEEAYLGRHRVGIDTGAYATGVLTAVRLEGADQRLIQASMRDRR
jgi:serine/threonine protein phosphatase 1